MHAVGATTVTMGRRDLDYDEVLRYIGQFGTFQVFLAHQDSAGTNLRTKMLPETNLLLALACVCRRWTGCDGLCFHRYSDSPIMHIFSPRTKTVFMFYVQVLSLVTVVVCRNVKH